VDELIFNASNGSFQAGEHFKISRHTTLDELISCFADHRLKFINHENGWLHVNVRNVRFGEYWFSFLFYYFEGLLIEIDFGANDQEVVCSWDGWSETEEMRCLKLYENWLYKQTGTIETHFPWGRIGAYYDSKMGGSVIRLQYK